MAVQEVPKSFIFTCDVCGKREHMATNVRPNYWVFLQITKDAYDFQGAAVADGSIKRLLCQSCSEKAIAALSKVI